LAQSSPIVIDRLIKGRYHLQQQLGQGGSGAVYQARDTAMYNRVVAIKEILIRGLTMVEAREAIGLFRQEAQILASLHHPSLPTIYEAFEEAGSCYLVMDFIEGGDLEAYVAQQGGKLSLTQTLEIALPLCDVLSYLHTRQPPIIFRDLKPANVMRTPSGHLYLVDFGIARHFKNDQVKDTMPFGSPGYAAPEQYGRAQTTPRSDIYSLGVLLHFLLSGADPSLNPFQFSPLSLSALGGAEMATLIQHMITLDIQHRPETIAEVESELRYIRPLQQRGALRPQSSSGNITALGNGSGKKRNNKQKSNGAGTASGQVVDGQQIQVQLLAPSQQKRQTKPQKPVPKRSTRRRVIGWVAALGGLALGGVVLGAIISENDEDSTTESTSDVRFASAFWSPDERYIAYTVYEHEGMLHIKDVQSGKEIATLQIASEENAGTFSLAWSPDSKRLAISVDQDVQIWDREQRKLLLTYQGHSYKSRAAVSWSPDGMMVASAVYGELHIWRVASRSLLFHTNLSEGENSYYISEIAWSPDSKRVAIMSSLSISQSKKSRFSAQIYDVGQQKQVYVRNFADSDDYSVPLAWSPARPFLATFVNGELWLLHTEDEKQSYSVKNLFSDASKMVWSPDGRTLAFLESYDKVATWNLDTRTPAIFPNKSYEAIKALAWDVEGKQVLRIDAKGVITKLAVM
jgi:serine/threonine protein kinase